MFITLLKRELMLARRNWVAVLIPLFFFIMVVSLFPFAVSPEAEFLRQIAPGVIWVSALLATLLSLDFFYRGDYQDGSLEQLLIMSSPTQVALSKVVAHWLVTGLPLVLVSPLLAGLMHLNYSPDGILLERGHTPIMMFSLLLGTPSLCLLGAIGMSLSLGASRNGMLVAVMILPLYVPILIFGSAVITASLGNSGYNAQLAILAAILLFALTLTPFAIGRALKVAVS
ncbi:heme exporter protein CcmB [Kangiella sp. HZ709]|uniref:heme exporter protein CcmB n=1 Tax=Kangiella sp. HZ709 TaxID=2666328 RepID=UPI0012B105E4|nr:heme exporter protein CcmB [Kangiella sp. HZ709]MRX26562.1 heme exporter protein CcmB [Kangiella sp. HZ709]